MLPKTAAVVICLLIGAVVAGVFLYRSYLRERDARHVSSCANHFNHLQLGLTITAEEIPDLVLPSTGDTRTALSAISADFNHPPG